MAALTLALCTLATTVIAARIDFRSNARLRIPRGLTPIPTGCATVCAPFAPFLQGATCPATECCSQVFETAYASCFQCVGAAENTTDFSRAQVYVDVVNTACASEGFPLPVITLPGQDPNRTLATALPADASAVPVFGASSDSVRGPSTTPRSRPMSTPMSSSSSSRSVSRSLPPSASSASASASTAASTTSAESSASQAPSPSSAASGSGSGSGPGVPAPSTNAGYKLLAGHGRRFVARGFLTALFLGLIS